MKGTQFKAIRKEMKLTQPILAEKLGLTLRTITNLEKSEDIKNHYAYAIQFLRYQDKLKDLGRISNEITTGAVH